MGQIFLKILGFACSMLGKTKTYWVGGEKLILGRQNTSIGGREDELKFVEGLFYFLHGERGGAQCRDSFGGKGTQSYGFMLLVRWQPTTRNHQPK